jgi:hypothetical protein
MLSQFDELSGLNTFLRKLLKIYGGIGSFSDLVIFKNGQPSVEINVRLVPCII